MFRFIRSRAAAIGLAFLLGASAAWAQSPTRVRGTIERLDGPILTVKSREGADVTVRLADNLSVSGVVKAALTDIKPGSYVGIAALPRAGELNAVEVLVFPEAMRGTAEGHGPWDLLPESTMTNATVAESVDRVQGRTLTLKYKDGERTITVPPEAPIVTLVPADRTELKPGAAVFIPATRQPDGSLQASRVLVGRDIAPPM
jgi:hypothetical protein